MTQLEDFRNQMVKLKARENIYREALEAAATSDERYAAKSKLSAYRTAIKELQEQINHLDPTSRTKKQRKRLDIWTIPSDWMESQKAVCSDLEGHNLNQIEAMETTEVGYKPATLMQWMEEGAERMTDLQATYINEYYNNGLSIQAIADMHGVDKSAVARAMKRGRNKMKDWVDAKKKINECTDKNGGFDWAKYIYDIAVLTDRQRQLLLLLLSLEPKSKKELAKKLNIDPSTVCTTVNRGLHTIKKLSVPVPIRKTTRRPKIEHWDTAGPLSLALQVGVPLGQYYRFSFRNKNVGATSRYRAELWLRKMAGWTVKQTADEFGISQDRVRSVWGNKPKRIPDDVLKLDLQSCCAAGSIGAQVSPETYRSLQRMVTVGANS